MIFKLRYDQIYQMKNTHEILPTSDSNGELLNNKAMSYPLIQGGSSLKFFLQEPFDVTHEYFHVHDENTGSSENILTHFTKYHSSAQGGEKMNVQKKVLL